jgi:hypothetical protein
MADQVARITAGFSALIGASSLAVAFANYRLARPRLTIKFDYRFDRATGVVYLDVRFHNRSQAAVKLSPELQLVTDNKPPPWTALWVNRMFTQVVDVPRPKEAEESVGPFGGVRWMVPVFDPAKFVLPEHSGPSRRWRIQMDMPYGAVVASRWSRKQPPFRGHATGNAD